MKLLTTLLAMAIAACIGTVAAEAGLAGGPSEYILSALIASLIFASLMSYAAWFIALNANDSDADAVTFGITVAFVCSLVGFLIPLTSAEALSYKAHYLNHNAEALRETGLLSFASIDTDHNGVLTEEELTKAETLSAIDLNHIADLKTNLEDMGHVIGSHQKEEFYMVDTVPSYYTTTVKTYGISREDLQALPARINEKYKNWLAD